MIELDTAAFRLLFPQFADTARYPDALLAAQWGAATTYISASPYGCMAVEARTYALQLMLGHLLSLHAQIAAGGAAGVVQQSKVGDVAVSLHAPPYGTSPWRYWLNLTPLGVSLLALLDAQASGGFYVGGLPERSAFRKVAGIF